MVETSYRLYRSNDTHRRTGEGEGERALKRMALRHQVVLVELASVNCRRDARPDRSRDFCYHVW